MDKYHSFKQELLQINQDISSLFLSAGNIPGIGEYAFHNQDTVCDKIREQISGEMLKIAVAGPIKSGKSTFVNALFKGDYLKRGAGVITSIVTRIHRGENLKAYLWFKSWNKVNSDIEKAMVLFPSSQWRSEKDSFDICREKDRKELSLALESLSSDLLITNDTRSVNSVLLSSYIKGYDRVKDIILKDKTAALNFDADKFEEHKEFAGDDSLAVYLNDIQLEINSGHIDSNIEIADCQGSDSPNPLHLAMIQDYLLLTHLIVYVISSRTGLRQADIKFLSAIKKMGIIENTIFLINFDFSEHDSINDLNRVVHMVKEELAMIIPEPDVYTLSALFNLFKSKTRDDLTIKDNLRLAQWKGEIALSEFSNQETERFENAIHQKLTKERYALLLANHLERLRVINSGIEHWVTINNDILFKDAFGINEILEGIKIHEKKTQKIKNLIKNTLDGAAHKIKQSLRNDVDGFFDNRSGIPAQVISFIKNYNVAYNEFENHLKSSGFSNVMYLVFQDIRKALDAYMAESATPDIIRFVRDTEQKIIEHFETIAGPYDTMVREALDEYNSTMKILGIPPVEISRKNISLPDISSIKNNAGLKFPSGSNIMNYSASIKTDAVMRLGFYRFILFVKKLIKKPEQEKNKGEIMALKGGVARLKQETEKSVNFLFKDYRENIKYQYILKLADAVSNSFNKSLAEQFESYVTDLSQIAELVKEKRINKDQTSSDLKNILNGCQDVNKKINTLKQKIETS
ncbi:Dynamin superfamily protein [Desulfonema limicola]|uniref:Dynamin superfamily protein n=1 Tax=Desulfonema limicola TaxID=45656 RepID=A0A975GFZ3_9BACT|nr:dynamin family protein [Desulfonema limicola]QTA79709.1 Dynamin superfamily protein [Desulfonema limicola]